MAGVLLACVAGLFLGALNITTRRGLARSQDIEAGSAIITLVAFAVVAPFALGSGDAFDAGELWPFLLLGAFVPGVSLLMVVHAVRAAGASRAGILFGMAPLFSALFAVIAFGEPFQLALAIGTLLVVAGGVVLALEGERPADYRAYGAVLAVTVAAGFGLRDNIARAVGEEVSVDPLAQSTVVMLGGSLLLVANLLRRPAPFRRLRDAFLPFVWSGVVLAVGQGALFEALDRARVTVVAPLTGTGVLWTVVLSAIFIGRSELIGRRLIVVALLVVAGGTLVGVTR
ncbi:MAG TPA: DMT family transporter [Gaiellaceae bacterium]|nr:DMT family transporter [Gaiellaceae bacterium]